MKFYNDLSKFSASFSAKEHSALLGNCEECKMFFHIHPSAEILLVTKGELTVELLGKKPERVPAGTCAMFFPFQSHSYERPEGTEYFRFNFLPSLVKAFFTPNENNVGESSVFPINITAYQPFLEAVRRDDLSLYKVKGFLYSIIGDLADNVSFVKKGVDDNILNKVIAYINEHKSEHLTIASVAAALGYNEKYLSRSIKGAAGFGFSTLLSTLRMESASYLLKNTARTVVDIALECGFGSERSFYRSFKELTGLTPNEYRTSQPKKAVVSDALLHEEE
ncbi:MAG: helix-turn-helix transcriptional regulator [Clostridia bacterium]|nr:helix-turn-helix transcriptional regulator [Clostridia bacterium]